MPRNKLYKGIFIQDNLKDKLKEFSKKNGWTISAVAEKAIEEYMEKFKKKVKK